MQEKLQIGKEMDMSGLRKAAVLIDTLEPAVADLLLEQLSPTDAERVRGAWMELGTISPQERRQVLDEFKHLVPKIVQFRLENKEEPCLPKTGATGNKPKLEHPGVSGGEGGATAEGREKPFVRLLDAEADKVADILLTERPQTIALVLSQLPTQHAGAVLVRLPPSLQVEVMRRLADLEETDPEVLKEVDRALQAKLSDVVAMQRRRVAGWSAVAGILQSAPQAVSDRLLHTISRLAPDLAMRLPQTPVFEFNHLIRFDDVSLGLIFEQVDLAVAVLALWGTPLGFQERVLAQLPTDRAERIQKEIADMGPVRLSDVEEARSRVATLARQLAARQRIRVPPELLHRRMPNRVSEPGEGIPDPVGLASVNGGTFLREVA